MLAVEHDTLSTKKLHWQLHLDEIASLEPEEFLVYNAFRKHVMYKLDRNLIRNVNDISSYNSVAQNLYTYYYDEYASGEELKDLDNVFSERVANETRLIKLYIALLRKPNIKHEIVFYEDVN